MPISRRSFLVGGAGALVLAACSGASYDGISDEAEVPRQTTTATTEPATTAPPTTPPATTPPPTNPATTAPAAPATTAPPGAAPAAPPTTTRATVALGGTLSGEHGIGVAKRDWMQHAFDAPTLAAMRAVKAALDPDGILNPGKLLPPP